MAFWPTTGSQILLLLFLNHSYGSFLFAHGGAEGVQEYNVKPLGRTCAGTGQPLQPGSVCRSVLIEKDGELLRLDFSDAGWTQPPHGTVAQWRCVVPEPNTGPKKTFDPDELMRQFELLSEEASPAQDKFRYVLALLLLQRRRLKLEGTKVIDDQEFLELTGTRGEGTFLVLDQTLNDAEVEQLQATLISGLTEAETEMGATKSQEAGETT